MTTEIKVPVLPESVASATISEWYKKVGDPIKRDDNLVDIETDKVVLEVVAPIDGFLQKIFKTQGSSVVAEEVIGLVSTSAEQSSVEPEASHVVVAQAISAGEQLEEVIEPEVPAVSSVVQSLETVILPSTDIHDNTVAGPGARQALVENNLDIHDVHGTGKDGRVTMLDVEKAVSTALPPAASIPKIMSVPSSTTAVPTVAVAAHNQREEKRIAMTRLRATIAQRLVDAQHTAAILTTFNEVNMQPVIDLRTKYKEVFAQKNGVKLGYMSFFVKAVIESLKRFPSLNASIDGNDIIYHGFFDIGIAVAIERGLLVPIIRDADLLTMAEIESKIVDFAQRAQTGQIALNEMSGGTFTISNGGTFGSLLSTPIINPPQSAILGMHKIEDRAVVVDKQIVIRPMMYLALSYDHRIIDGSEAVGFLVTVKEILEDPARFLLNI